MRYQIYQGGMLMRGAEYYKASDPIIARSREALLRYMYLAFKQLGQDSVSASKNASSVYRLDYNIVTSQHQEGSRTMSVADLQKTTPDFNWRVYLQGYGIQHIDSLVVGNPDFFKAFNTLLKETPIEVWKNYLRIFTMMYAANFLNNESFINLLNYNSTYSGQTGTLPRWRRVLYFESNSIGDLLTHLVAKEYFSPAQKLRYTKMAEAFREAFKERIRKLNWMEEPTKQKAIEKLDKMQFRIGYPDTWDNMADVSMRPHAYFENYIQGKRHFIQNGINQLGKPFDKSQWKMEATMREASYDNELNRLTLEPAQFIVPRQKDEDLDDAFMYGYTFAAHEMSHGFDSNGVQYDANGMPVTWWTSKDSLEYESRLSALVRQFNEYVAIDTFHVNGEMTKRENMADLTGLLIGLDALKQTKQYKENQIIGGFTPLQRYFLGFAFRQTYVTRKELLLNQLLTNGHAPDKFRVNGTVVNVSEFYDAFNVRPGDKMYRSENLRVKIW
ncbi:hypothetical protein GCM10023229_09330 [Flavisolibacter ginsenosidimutans]